MKRITAALIFVLALLVLAVGEPKFVKLTTAAQIENSSTIQIEKPNSSVIYGHSVPLTFNVSSALDVDDYLTPEFSVLWLGYSLDDAPPVTIRSVPDTGWMSGERPPFQTTELFLFEVSDGQHKIEVMANGYFLSQIGVYGYNISSAPAYFTVDTVSALSQPSAAIHIASNGSVNPATAPIEHIGDAFRITANLNNTLIVEKNNIIIDGQGFTLQGPGTEVNDAVAVNLTCTNVTVANFQISNWHIGILGVFDNNTIIANNFTNNHLDVAVYANDYIITGNYIGAERIVGNKNVISKNQITLGTYTTGFWITNSSGTVIEANNITLSKLTTFFISTDNGNFQVYHNNFLNVEINTGGYLLFLMSYPQATNATSPPWDNGYAAGGNYWSDYSSRYPTAVELDGSGIGDTQYVSSTTPQVTDRYPLIAPYNFSKPTMPTQPNLSPSSSPTLDDERQQMNQTTVILCAAIIAIVLGAGVGLLVYFKKRKR